MQRTLATWPDPTATRPTLAYEPLQVSTMELPPGWRGYGERNHIEHPDTPARAATVEATQTAEQLSRHALQERLMPYRHLLPPSLRGDNDRLGDLPR
ncbi:MAG: hypothetical protein NTZ79_13160 [Proteobacteria bacterium]|nr:hypothetical protein [Pseudomonadota bacterium]